MGRRESTTQEQTGSWLYKDCLCRTWVLINPITVKVDLGRGNDLTQLYAVKFLTAIGGPSTLGPLKRAFAQDQWEVTRAVALSGIFQVSPADAKPYVEAALSDRSQLVQQYAHHLLSLYQQQNK